MGNFNYNEFMKNKDLSLAEKGMYLLLKSYCKEGENSCVVSASKEISVDAGTTAGVSLKIIKRLQEKGYVLKEQQFTDKGGKAPNKYTLLK